jgi:ankyrin repeat/BTB/POZ domain-containing protein 1
MDTKRKFEIERALAAESQAVSAGRLKEDNPLDTSEAFRQFCEACRRGDLKVCQEMIQAGVNVNARDRHDYTPLILVSAPITLAALVIGVCGAAMRSTPW